MPTVCDVSSRTLLLKNERSEGSVKETSVPHLRAELIEAIAQMEALLAELTVLRAQLPAHVLPSTFLQPASFGQPAHLQKFALCRHVQCLLVKNAGD